MKVALLAALCGIAAAGAAAGQAKIPVGPIPVGAAALVATLPTVKLDVFTYRPARCARRGLLVVLHGVKRDAASYRDDVQPVAERLCLLVLAPRFDEKRFPAERYQLGGVVAAGEVVPASERTGAILLALIAWARRVESDPSLPYAIIGHSAGGEFLSRVAAFTPSQAATIVIADPADLTLPSRDLAAPRGFSGLPRSEAGDLRRYLGAPIMLLVGSDDPGTAQLCADTFRQAAATATANGWTFGWRLSTIPGIGHDARAIFASREMLAALGAAE